MATEWKKIFIDLRAIKYDPAKLFLRQIENTLDLTKWINDGVAAGELNVGVFNLNTLVAPIQTLETTEDGTDFTITSAGTVHSFNLPIATELNPGKLSATDWSTFNNKENVLTFSSPFVRTVNTVSMQQASSLLSGFLSNTDWVTFNNKIGTASNGVNASGTNVKLGGALTENTTVGTGAFTFTLNAASYSVQTSASKLFGMTGSGTTNLWHGLNTGGYDSQRFNIQNTTGVNFTDTSGVTSLFIDNSSKRLGIGTTSPASRINTVAALTNQTDNITALSTSGFGFELSGTGYAGAIVNSGTGNNNNGFLVRVHGSNTNQIVFQACRNTFDNALRVRADAQVSIGGVYGGTANFADIYKLGVNGAVQIVTSASVKTSIGSLASGGYPMISYNSDWTTGVERYAASGEIANSIKLSGITSGNISDIIFQGAPTGTAGNNISYTEILRLRTTAGVSQIGFYGATPASRPTITGSRGGNAALQSLLTSLALQGLIIDSTTV